MTETVTLGRPPVARPVSRRRSAKPARAFVAQQGRDNAGRHILPGIQEDAAKIVDTELKLAMQ
jgi:hypothetical protein